MTSESVECQDQFFKALVTELKSWRVFDTECRCDEHGEFVLIVSNWEARQEGHPVQVEVEVRTDRKPHQVFLEARLSDLDTTDLESMIVNIAGIFVEAGSLFREYGWVVSGDGKPIGDRGDIPPELPTNVTATVEKSTPDRFVNDVIARLLKLNGLMEDMNTWLDNTPPDSV